MEDEERISKNTAGSNIYNLFSIFQSSVRPFIVSLLINSKQLGMEVDTGAVVSVMGQKKFNQLWSGDDWPILKRTNVKIHIYTGQEIKPCGEALVEVSYNNNVKRLTIIVLITG